MASMNLDPSSALAEKYKGNRQILEAAVLGRGADANIDPYSALRALQKLNVADKYEQMQKAMAGQPNPPSIAQQTIAQAAQGQQPAPASQAPAPQAPQAPAPQAPQGLGAMPVPEDTFNMAGGGIVAFAEGEEVPDSGADLDNTELTPEGKAQLNNAMLQLKAIEHQVSQPSMTNEQRQAAIKSNIATIKDYLGGDQYYEDIRNKLAGMEADRAAGLERSKGLGALQAAAALSQGNNLLRGLGAAGAAYGTTYGKALSEAEQDKRNIIKSQMELADAQRREKMSLYSTALSSLANQDKATIDRYKLGADMLKAQAALVRAGRAPTGRGPNAELEQIRILADKFQAQGMSRPDAEAKAVTTYQGLKQQTPRFRSKDEALKFSEIYKAMHPDEWKAILSEAKGNTDEANRRLVANLMTTPTGTTYEDIYNTGGSKPPKPQVKDGVIPELPPSAVPLPLK